MYVDGSYHWPSQRMFYAAVVYDHRGRVRLRRLGSESGGDSAEAEALAALLGICSIRELHNGRPPAGWKLLSDHRGLIQAIRGQRDITGRLRPYVAEARLLLAGGEPVWVSRERNFSAHWTADQRHLAREGVVCELPVDDQPPRQAAHAQRLADARRRLRFADSKTRVKAAGALAPLTSPAVAAG